MSTPLQDAILRANREQYGDAPRTASKLVAKIDETVSRVAGHIPGKRNGRSHFHELELAYLLKRTPGIPADFECGAKIIPGRQFEVDFVWKKQKLVLELEGGIWMKGFSGHGGAHSLPTNILRDMEKGNLLALEGYHLLRFSTEQHKRGEIVPFLLRFFSSHR